MTRQYPDHIDIVHLHAREASAAGRLRSSRLVFTDAAALRQCRSGWMTRYRKLSGSELSPSVPRQELFGTLEVVLKDGGREGIRTPGLLVANSGENKLRQGATIT